MESEKEKGRRSRTWTNMANVCRGLRTPPSVRPFSPPQQGESLPSESECAVYIWAFPQSHKIELLDYLMLGRGEQNKFSLSSIGMIDVHRTVVILYNVYICTFIARQQATREKQNSECYCKERIMDNLGAGWFPHQDGSQARLLCASFSQAQPLPPPVLVSANNGVTGQLTVIHTYVVWRSASGAWAHQWSDRATDLDWSTA